MQSMTPMAILPEATAFSCRYRFASSMETLRRGSGISFAGVVTSAFSSAPPVRAGSSCSSSSSFSSVSVLTSNSADMARILFRSGVDCALSHLEMD